uniref:Uncharacterized protein n=1 Tax=Rhizophora mucronata TaxID=61149 RepID=A0A2P2NSB6_RHIMU
MCKLLGAYVKYIKQKRQFLIYSTIMLLCVMPILIKYTQVCGCSIDYRL